MAHSARNPRASEVTALLIVKTNVTTATTDPPGAVTKGLEESD